MKYSITRKYNLKERLPDNPPYEMIDFAILEADNPKEAETALEIWVKDWFTKKKAEFDAKKTPMDKFEERLIDLDKQDE